MALRIKHGVDLRGLQPQALIILQVAIDAFAKYDCDAIVTRGTDNVAGSTIIHSTGFALDFRIKHLPYKNTAALIGEYMRDALGPQFDVVVKLIHIHTEFDWRPK